MSLSVYSPATEASAPDSWFDCPDELPSRVVQDVAALVSRTCRDPGRALAVLDLLCRSPRAMSRKRLAAELGIPASALARTIALLDENGFVNWTKRFGIGLGVRFTEYGEPFTRHLDRGLFCLVTPYLDLLAQERGGTAFLALRAGDGLLVPRASGVEDAAMIAGDDVCVAMADGATSHPWTSLEPWVYRPSSGIWAARAPHGRVAIAARVTLAHSVASIGLLVPLPSTDAYEDCCRSLGQSAAQLTSALRRQFPQ